MTTYSVGWCEHDPKGESHARQALRQIPALANVDTDSLPVLKCLDAGYPSIKVLCLKCYKEEILNNKIPDFMVMAQV